MCLGHCGFFYSDPVVLENADVSPKDLPFLKIGAVFYRVVGRCTTPHGALWNFSALYFLRDLYFLRKFDLNQKLEWDSWGTEVEEQFWQPFVGELKCSMDDIHRSEE